MNENFLCRVSFAGVPHTLTHSSSTANANLFPITPQKLCKMYWLLSSLAINYSYSINGVSVARSYSVTSTVVPKNRLIAPAMFYETGYDSYFQTSYMARLDFSTAYFNASNLENVGINFSLSESDEFSMFQLCLKKISGMKSVQRDFSIAGKTMRAYLNYDSSLVSSAALSAISVAETYNTTA